MIRIQTIPDIINSSEMIAANGIHDRVKKQIWAMEQGPNQEFPVFTPPLINHSEDQE